MNELLEKHCVPCEGGVAPLEKLKAEVLLKKLNGWKLDESAKSISRDFQFKNFYQTMGFVNAVAWIANQENHHPDLRVGYKDCTITYTTHAIDGLSENDFICAAKVDQLGKL